MSSPPRAETIFTMEATPLKFGPGAHADAGWELARRGATRVMLVTEPGIVRAGITERVVAAIAREGIEVVVFDDVHVEPTLDSFQRAVDFALDGGFDAFVGCGGGSCLDTAKVADLLSTHPGEIMDYVNPPLGAGRKPPFPLKTHVAIPTTSGTGSEATSVAVLDIPQQRVKTGISHSYLRPQQAIVDPELTRSMPAAVSAATGLDVVCHAVESFISRPYYTREAPASPGERPPYQGSNPLSDVWSARALELGGAFLRRAVADGDDVEARGQMMLGAMLAGIGFGSAGVHIPHACAYPLAALRHDYRPAGYELDHNVTPHGFSVIVTSPAAFRFTYAAAPEKHRRAAELLSGEPIARAGEETLPDVLISLMRDVGAPRGIAELGYTEDDLDELVEGAMKQARLLAVAPLAVGADDVREIMRASWQNW